MDCVAKIVSYMPESETKEVAFDEPVLAEAFHIHQEKIRECARTIYGAQTIIQIVNDAIDFPEDWLGRQRHVVDGYHKWISFEFHDYSFTLSEIQGNLILKPPLYQEIKRLCVSLPVRVQSRLVHHVHNSCYGYTIGILWPFLNITLEICENIMIEEEVSTEISRSYRWEKTFQSNVCSICMSEQRNEYPDQFELTISSSQEPHDMDAVVLFIETVMSLYPDLSMPEWNLITTNKMTKKMLQPYKYRLWQYGIKV